MDARIKMIVFLILAPLLLSGCFLKETIKDEEVQNTPVLTKPPILTISANKEHSDAVLGTTSWYYSNGDGTYTGFEGDSGPPPELIKYQEKRINIGSGKEILLTFENQPIHYSVSIWDSDKPIAVEVINDKITIPQHKGILIFEVNAKWNEGNALYAFSLNVK